MVRIRNKHISVPRYDRKEKHYSLEEVLSQTIFDTKRKGKAYKVNFDGEWINMASDRYQCFAVYGTTCVDCGIEGAYFIMERQGNFGQFHFNLYALDNDGNEVLMTKDHITPRSRGGRDELKNYQPMCTACNNKKGSQIIYPVNTWLIPAYV
jgi:5-methylcytosine-specific restriction endonuclease McrA